MSDVKLTREQIELIRKAYEAAEQPTAVALYDMVLTLELEAADLRERLGTEMAGKEALLICIQTACEVLGEQVQPAFLPDLIEERLAKAREEAIEECKRVCLSVQSKYKPEFRFALNDCIDDMTALTQKGADHSGKIEKQHQWSDDGERCVKCGDKDWMGGPCNG